MQANTDQIVSRPGTFFATDIDKSVHIFMPAPNYAILSGRVVHVQDSSTVRVTFRGDRTFEGAQMVLGTDDRAAIQNAIYNSRRVQLPNKAYLIDGSLKLPRFQQLHCFGKANAGASDLSGSCKIYFVGSHASSAGFENEDPHRPLSHGGLYGITVTIIGDYDGIATFHGLEDFTINDASFLAFDPRTAGLHSISLDNYPSWLNTISNSRFQLSDFGTRYVLDHDWSDSNVTTSAFAGGYGTRDTGYGTRYSFNNFERSSQCGVTLQKYLPTTASLFIGNFFDANSRFGFCFDMKNDKRTNGTVALTTSLIGNVFRTEDARSSIIGVADIGFFGNDSTTYTGGIIMGNQFSLRLSQRMLFDHSRWKSFQFYGNSAPTP